MLNAVISGKPGTRDVTMAMNFCFALCHGVLLELCSRSLLLFGRYSLDLRRKMDIKIFPDCPFNGFHGTVHIGAEKEIHPPLKATFINILTVLLWAVRIIPLPFPDMYANNLLQADHEYQGNFLEPQVQWYNDYHHDPYNKDHHVDQIADRHRWR